MGALAHVGAGRMTRRGDAVALSAVTAGLAVGAALVTAQQPIVGVGLALFALLAVAALRDPSVATVAVVAAVYLNVPVVLSRYHGVPAAAAGLLPLALAVPFGARYFGERRVPVIPISFLWFAGFVLVQALGAMVARNQVAASGEVVTSIAEGLVLYLLLVNVLRSTELVRTVALALVLAGGAMGALTGLQYATRTYGDSYGGFARVSRAVITSESGAGLTDDQRAVLVSQGRPRAAGPVGEPNRYAQVQAVLIPVGLLLHRRERSRPLRNLLLLCIAGSAAGVALAYSRGAVVAVGGVLVLMAALGYFRARQVAFGGVAALLVVVSVPGFTSRLAAIGDVFKASAKAQSGEGVDTAIRGRLVENLTALQVFSTHPLVGVGPGEFPSYYPEVAADLGLQGRTVPREAHNLYLGVAAESGLLGVFALGGMVITTLRMLRRAAARAGDGADSDLAMAFFFAIVTYLATGFFLHISYARYLWLLMAVAAAAGAAIGAPATRLAVATTRTGSSTP